jgi:hypothetical protein
MRSGIPIPASETPKRTRPQSPPSPSNDHDQLAFVGKLQGVAYEVEENLAEPARIAVDTLGHFGVYEAGKFEVFLFGPGAEELQALIEGITKVEIEGFQFNLARLYFGEIEDFVEQIEEGLRRGLDGVGIVLLLRAEFARRMPSTPFMGVRACGSCWPETGSWPLRPAAWAISRACSTDGSLLSRRAASRARSTGFKRSSTAPS